MQTTDSFEPLVPSTPGIPTSTPTEVAASPWGTEGGWDEGSGGTKHMRRAITALLIVFAILLVGAGALGFYLFVYRAPHAAAVSVQGTVPEQIFGGEPFTMTIGVTNTDQKPISRASLTLAVPESVTLIGEQPNARSLSIPVGELAPGQEFRREVRVIAYGDENSVQRATASLTYVTAAAPDTSFEERHDIDIPVGKPAVSATIDGPKYVANGKEFNVTVRYRNNLNHTVSSTIIVAQYPTGFVAVGSVPQAQAGTTNSWLLPELDPNEEGSIAVRGTITGVEVPTVPFGIAVTASSSTATPAITTQQLTLAVLPDPLRITVKENSGGTIARIGTAIAYEARIKNITTYPIRDVIVTASLNNPLLESARVNTNGVYSSLHSTVTWNAAVTSALKTLGPGEEAVVQFSVPLRAEYPLRTITDKDFIVAIDVGATSPTVPLNTAINEISVSAHHELKLAGDLGFDAQGYWKEVRSDIRNTGPYPPRVNQPTQYTIHWILTSKAADMKNVRITATLQNGAHVTGEVRSTIDAKPQINDRTGEIVWEVPLVAANTGLFGTKPIEAIFQIEHTPSSAQAGREVVLVSEARVGAIDAFSGSTISERDDQVGTGIPDDKQAPRSGAVVAQ